MEKILSKADMEELRNLPDKLFALRTQLLGLACNKEELERNVEEQKLVVKSAVASQADAAGKPKFPNEFARTAEVERILREKPDFNKWEREINQLGASIEGNKVAISFLQDRLKVYDILARLATAE